MPATHVHGDEAVALLPLTYRPAAATAGGADPPAHVKPGGQGSPVLLAAPAGQYVPAPTLQALAVVLPGGQ